jgi:hypothetical protein
MTRRKCAVCRDRPCRRQLDFEHRHNLCDVCARNLALTQRRVGGDTMWTVLEWAAKRARSAERRRGKERA